MNDRAPGVIVSLPATTVAEARDQLARAAGADLAEVRFDLWTSEERERVAELFPSPLPLVATLRSRAEGGRGPDDSGERAEILLKLSRSPFRWIDLEVARDTALEPRLPSAESTGRIRSSHATQEVSLDEWRRLLRDPVPLGSVRKVVVPSSVGRALLELIPEIPPPDEAMVVALTTGASGPLLRALSRRLHLPFVYAALPQALPEGGEPPSPVEPSQIPVDRLRPFLEAREPAPIFAIAGHPVEHSRSPALHSRWMKRTERAGLYIALDFASEEEFVESLAPLAAWGFFGLNVTHPLKAAALEAATEVGSAAQACGVANCLTLRGEEVEAENTDLAAILRRFEELKAESVWDGSAVTVVGTGGAARATLAAARALGAGRRLVGRNPQRLRELADAFGARILPASELRPDSLVVHATDVGRAGTGPLGAPLEQLVDRSTHVIDWVYAPEVPLIRETTLRAGGTYEDGRRLLVYQAAASFGLWWGEEPEPEEIAETLREEGCAA